jgi:hypothetical protein
MEIITVVFDSQHNSNFEEWKTLTVNKINNLEN